MSEPLETLTAGPRKFCIGRLLGMAALAELPPVAIDLDGEEGIETEATEMRLSRERDLARGTIENQTRVALAERRVPIEVFLPILADAVAAARLGTTPNAYAEPLRRRIAAFEAQPFDPLESIFDVALQASRWMYERAGHPVDGQGVRCELSLGPKNAEGTLPYAPAVNGALRSGDANLIVQLILSPQRFWTEELCALTYTAIHELVVHGFASSNARNSVDSFAEGWMDHVAYQLHRTLVGDRVPGLRSALSGHFPGAQQELCAQLVHIARSEARELNKRGREAAIEARRALGRALGGDPVVADEAMCAFSVALNRSSVGPSRRAEVCEAVGRAAVGSGPLESRWLATVEAVQAAASPTLKLDAVERFTEDPEIDA